MHIIMKITYFVTLAIGFIIVDGARMTLHPKNDVTTKYNVQGERLDEYSSKFATLPGSRKKRSYLKTDLMGHEYLVKEEAYSYIGDNNQVYKVNSIVDENGYGPTVSKLMTRQPKNLAEVMERIESDDFVFPEDTDFEYTTRKSIFPAASTTTEPIFTDDDIFTTTIIPIEGSLENRISNKLKESALG